MDTDLLLKTLNKGHSLALSDQEIILGILEEEKFNKNDFLQHDNERSRRLYFIKSGVVRIYFNSPEKQVTYLFAREGEFVTSTAFFDQTRAEENIIAEETTEVLSVSYPDLMMLMHSTDNISRVLIYFCNLYRRMALRRLRSLLEDSPEERVRKLFARYPDILQKTKPEHVASYCGISRTSLYRTMKKLK
ncbi:CRP-like cAMP-binding protein [Arcticibacter tournemirensis]|uniref:Crp/Fnr family transcriptional regulator n=1 Tax=Arcticibacter tournemirensis TaxID=699437 RepID=A0A5M9GQ86_9SPHI|nr:Crp/Fnr family transcriptional regulator [Arcticibacter tournemirensis]KAA8474934.1 Crp/Fnr family transcriptional regulator [Arcticibacter tournemirensis]TQM48529.1 CRP-like cAMP-binding protein [Arcticibacter tournemirensis]